MPPRGRQPGAGAPVAHYIEQMPPPKSDAEWTPIPGTIQHVAALGDIAVSVVVDPRPLQPYEQAQWHRDYVQRPMEEMRSDVESDAPDWVRVEADDGQGHEATAVFGTVRFNAGLLRVPNHLDRPGDPETSRVVQSVEMVTRPQRDPREPEDGWLGDGELKGKRHRARLVDMRYVYGEKAKPIADQATEVDQSESAKDGGIARKALETTLRIMTTAGANGLHHVFQTVIGGEIAYYSTSQSAPYVFVAKVGVMPRGKDTPRLPGEVEGDTIPVFGIIATGTDLIEAQKLFKHLGGTQADVDAISPTGKKKRS